MALGALLIFLLLAPLSRCSATAGFCADLTHVDSLGSFTATERLRHAVQRSRHHARLLTGKPTTVDVEAPVHAIQGAYFIDLSVGSPAIRITGAVSSGSEIVWVNCGSCAQCTVRSTRSYKPTSSSTFRSLSSIAPLCPSPPKPESRACEYSIGYVGTSSTYGVIARESFGFGYANRPATTVNLAFMCGSNNTGYYTSIAAGVGIGRGKLSLISQLKATKFSYCLTSLNESKSSPLVVGSPASLHRSKGKIQSTPLLPSPPAFPFFFHYYVSLEGISVGGELLPIPKTTFELQANGSGGLVIDTGSSLTSLEAAAFEVLKKKIVSIVSLPVVTLKNTNPGDHPDVCFRLPAGCHPPDMPDVVFHLAGAHMTFPRDKYMILESTSGLYCLAFIPQKGVSILGTYQQQNLHILYDLKNSVLSFVPTQCDML